MRRVDRDPIGDFMQLGFVGPGKMGLNFGGHAVKSAAHDGAHGR